MIAHMASISTSSDTVVHLKTALGALDARWEAATPTASQSGILKCLGTQYANIPYRWAPPRKVVASPWEDTRDCTQFGPGCPQTGSALFVVDRVAMFG